MKFFQMFVTALKKSGFFIGRILMKAADAYDNFREWFEPRNIFKVKSESRLATTETLFSAITRLSSSMASLPIKTYKGKYEQADLPVSVLTAYSPNPNMTAFEFIRTMEVMRNSTGNAYALKEYEDRFYQVKALWILDSSKVEPVIEKDSRELWYQVDGTDGRYYVHNTEMIHTKHIHMNTYKGISPLDVLRDSVDYDQKVREFSLSQIDSAVKASFILSMATNLSPEKKEQVQKNFAGFYKENGGVLIEEMGTKIREIEREFIDTKALEIEKVTRERVAIVFNMPVHMLGQVDTVRQQSVEQLTLEYIQTTLAPIVRQYEQELNRKLLNEEQRRQGFYHKFNLNALLRGDMKTRGDFYFRGIRTGVLKPNEARAWEDLPPVSGGELLYMSKDLEPIEKRGEETENR